MSTLFEYDIITTVFTPLGGPAICRWLGSGDAGVLRPWLLQPGTFFVSSS